MAIKFALSKDPSGIKDERTRAAFFGADEAGKLAAQLYRTPEARLRSAVGTFAKAGFEFFLGNIPEACSCFAGCPVNAQSPVVVLFDECLEVLAAHRAVDFKQRAFVGLHLWAKAVDKVCVWLKHQGDEQLLAFF